MKKILLGVSGSIAAYKAADIASGLVKNDYSVTVVMSDQAKDCLLYTSPSPRDRTRARMPSSA